MTHPCSELIAKCSVYSCTVMLQIRRMTTECGPYCLPKTSLVTTRFLKACTSLSLLQVIRAHRLEREADYAAQREHEWEQALAQEAQRHRSHHLLPLPGPPCITQRIATAMGTNCSDRICGRQQPSILFCLFTSLYIAHAQTSCTFQAIDIQNGIVAYQCRSSEWCAPGLSQHVCYLQGDEGRL